MDEERRLIHGDYVDFSSTLVRDHSRATVCTLPQRLLFSTRVSEARSSTVVISVVPVVDAALPLPFLVFYLVRGLRKFVLVFLCDTRTRTLSLEEIFFSSLPLNVLAPLSDVLAFF